MPSSVIAIVRPYQTDCHRAQENGVVRFKWKAEKTADGYKYATAYNKKFIGQSKKKTKKRPGIDQI